MPKHFADTPKPEPRGTEPGHIRQPMALVLALLTQTLARGYARVEQNTFSESIPPGLPLFFTVAPRDF